MIASRISASLAGCAAKTAALPSPKITAPKVKRFRNIESSRCHFQLIIGASSNDGSFFVKRR
jgi:hypothetical protein